MERKLDAMHEALFVDKGLNNPAAMTRLALLEKDAGRRDWFIRTALGGAIVAIVATVYGWFTTGK